MHTWFSQSPYWFGRMPFGGPMFIFGFIILIALGLLVFIAVTKGRRGITHKPDPDPTAILKARYAAGEITRDEYQTMLSDLKS